ncbi:hypothetical protein D3C76_1198040 [compost metagenome]
MGVLGITVGLEHGRAEGAAVIQHIHFHQLVIYGWVAVLLPVPLGIFVDPGAFRNMAHRIIDDPLLLQKPARLQQPVKGNPQGIIPLGEQNIVKEGSYPCVRPVYLPEGMAVPLFKQAVQGADAAGGFLHGLVEGPYIKPGLAASLHTPGSRQYSFLTIHSKVKAVIPAAFRSVQLHQHLMLPRVQLEFRCIRCFQCPCKHDLAIQPYSQLP